MWPQVQSLEKFEIHRNDRQNANGKTKHGGIMIGINKERPHRCYSLDFDDCLITNLQ